MVQEEPPVARVRILVDPVINADLATGGSPVPGTGAGPVGLPWTNESREEDPCRTHRLTGASPPTSPDPADGSALSGLVSMLFLAQTSFERDVGSNEFEGRRDPGAHTS